MQRPARCAALRASAKSARPPAATLAARSIEWGSPDARSMRVSNRSRRHPHRHAAQASSTAPHPGPPQRPRPAARRSGALRKARAQARRRGAQARGDRARNDELRMARAEPRARPAGSIQSAEEVGWRGRQAARPPRRVSPSGALGWPDPCAPVPVVQAASIAACAARTSTRTCSVSSAFSSAKAGVVFSV